MMYSSDESLPDILNPDELTGPTMEPASPDLPDPALEPASPELFEQDPQLPIFDRGESSNTMSAAALLINGDQQPVDRISTAVPQAVHENAAFLIDTRKLGNWKDINSDGLGAWTQSTCKSHFFHKNDNAGTLEYLGMDGKCYGPQFPNTFRLRRRPYVNKSSHDCRKSVITCQDNKGSYLPHMYVCYYFENVNEFGKHSPIHVLPHGNAKNSKSKTPYVRKFKSTMDLAKAFVKRVSVKNNETKM